MKWFLSIVLLVIGFIPAWLGVAALHARMTEVEKRFRLTIAIETPEGMKASSSVLRATQRRYDWMPFSGLPNVGPEYRLSDLSISGAILAGCGRPCDAKSGNRQFQSSACV